MSLKPITSDGWDQGKDGSLPVVVHQNRPENGGKCTWWLAAGHIITAFLGTGILAMPYIFSWLGWVGASVSLLLLFLLTRWTAGMLAEIYQVNGKCHPDYDEAVNSILGNKHGLFLSISRHVNLILANVGFQIAAAAAVSYVATEACKLHGSPPGSCWNSQPVITVAVGGVQLLLSQFRDLQAVTWCSAVGAVASLAYCAITFGLAASQAQNHLGSIAGTPALIHDKLFSAFSALGAIGFGLNAPIITLEVADTLRQPPAAAVSMQKSLTLSLGACVVMFAAGGTLGYLALGDGVGDNFLLAFEGVAPVWVMFLGQIVVVLIMVPAYQVCGQPTFAAVEQAVKRGMARCRCSLPSKVWLLHLAFRGVYVAVTTLLAATLPFFVLILGLCGSVTFYQTAILYPILLHRRVFPPHRAKACLMNVVLVVAAVVTLLALVGSIAEIVIEAAASSPLKA